MSLETNIFLIRHGETEWNEQDRLQGSQDSPLTSHGVIQAREAKSSLEKYTIDQAYVSPLKRAGDTLEIILEGRKLAAVVRDSLREMNLGPWEGKTRDESAKSHPTEYIAFWEEPGSFSLPGADTFDELQYRIVGELESIFVEGKNKNILVVSHWIAIKVALAHYSSVSLSNLSDIADPANGGFIRLCKRGDDVSVYR